MSSSSSRTALRRSGVVLSLALLAASACGDSEEAGALFAGDDAGGDAASMPDSSDSGERDGASAEGLSPCTTQADCAADFFCDPTTPAATTGFCVPRSPAHCKTCSANAECGSLSEVCGTVAGDPAKACHIDCSIAGADACPADYSCVSTTLNGNSAKVCRPSGNVSCLDSLGGFCDGVTTPQDCSREDEAGTCSAQRICLTPSNRYASCSAAAPACKPTCASTDPAGCSTSFCTEATSTPENCGTCGTTCPGLGSANVNVTCNQPTCGFSCKGETYDVDNDKTTGCEAVDSPTNNHSMATATNIGALGCADDFSNPNIAGTMVSDSEKHENGAVDGFDATSGSAPDYYKIRAMGSDSCSSDVALTLHVTASAYPSCYHLHVGTNKHVYDCDTNAAGKCSLGGVTDEFDNGTDIFVVVSKRDADGCRAAEAREKVNYTVTGHL